MFKCVLYIIRCAWGWAKLWLGGCKELMREHTAALCPSASAQSSGPDRWPWATGQCSKCKRMEKPFIPFRTLLSYWTLIWTTEITEIQGATSKTIEQTACQLNTWHGIRITGQQQSEAPDEVFRCQEAQRAPLAGWSPRGTFVRWGEERSRFFQLLSWHTLPGRLAPRD